jgi:hypothetical protein
MKITIDINAKTIGAVLLGVIPALLLTHRMTSAQSTTASFTGKCAGVSTVVRKFQTVNNDKATDTIFLIDFDKKEMYSVVNLTDTVTSPGRVKYVSQPMITETFSISTGDIPGSFLMTTPNGDKTLAIPVNNGTSFVFQFVNDNIIGMCQKL